MHRRSCRRIVPALLWSVGAIVAGCGGAPAAHADKPAASASATPPSASLPAVEPEISTGVPAARITESSRLQAWSASGILRAAEPGWHAAAQPSYPQWVQIDLERPRTVKSVSLLPQDTYAKRGPKQIEVQGSSDGTHWMPMLMIGDACEGGENRWRTFPLGKAEMVASIKLVIQSNCGDPDYLTLRGIKVE